MEKIYDFGTYVTERAPIPGHAEELNMSHLTKHKNRKSRYVEGHTISVEVLTCPSKGCNESWEYERDFDHGWRWRCCGCGMLLENYGNSLVVWRDDEKKYG